MSTNGSIEAAVRDFVIEAFLPGDDGADLTNDTDLVAGGIVDSVNVLRLVEFMEDEYDIMIEHDELRRLTSIVNISTVVHEKIAP